MRLRLVLGAAMLASVAARAEGVPPRLSGTVVAGAARVAIFAAHGAQVPLEEGEGLDGYTVLHVRPGAVEVSGPGGAVVLTPMPDAPPPRSLQVTADANWDPNNNK